MPNSGLKLAIADDHQLFRQGIVTIIKQSGIDCEVVLEAIHGKMLIERLEEGLQIDLAIIDANMPILDGYDTARILKKKWPSIKVLALTMVKDEQNLIKLLKAGVDGYLNKDADPAELTEAIMTTYKTGTYYSDLLTGQLISSLKKEQALATGLPKLTKNEMRFMNLACSDHTYQMIADEMCLSIKTVDGYRARLFDKLQVKSRVGLVVFALKNNLVSLDSIA